jgi:hypothetical protein
MANGYLGKISAVVSANTADFSSKLNAAAKDVQKFASSMQGSLSSAQSSSSSSLRGIYTDAQKLERALTAISTRKLQFRGFQGPDLQSAVARMQALYSATEQINKPLADAAKSFGRLSLSVQGEFNPALVSAQASVEKLADTINRTGTASADQFARVARQVEVTTAAMSRMKEAGAMVSGLATGQELRFQRPEMAAEMRRSATVQSEAAQMAPAAMASAGVAGLVQQQAAAARETERLAAALENEKLLVNGNVAAATSAYETQLAVQRRINDEIERRVRLSAESANEGRSQDIRAYLQQLEDARLRTEALADAQRRAQAASRFLQVDQGESNLMANEGRSQDIRAYLQQLEDARQRTEALADAQRRAQAASRFLQVDQNESNLMANEGRSQDIRAYLQQLEDARQRTEALADAQRRAQAASRFLQVDQGESNLMANEGRSQDIRAYLQQLEDARQRTEALADAQRRAQAASRFLRVDQGESDLMANEGRSTPIGAGYYEDNLRRAAASSMGQDIEAPRRQLAVLQSSITSLKSQIDTLPDGLRTRFVPAIREAEAEFIRLSAAPAAIPAEIEAARQRLIHLTQDATRAAQAMNFSQSFGGAGLTGVNLGLDQRALQGYNAQLQILQGAIGRASAEARGPAVAAFNTLRNAVATAFDEGNIDSGVQRDRLAAIRTEAIAAAAAVSRIRVGTLTRDVARAGDIGRAGFDRFSLALNQAAFAVDDFMSSTGGIEFKLRAISNNITQLAFILGGTTGLFVGLGAVIAGQAAVGLIRWYNNGRTAEDQTKALNEALSRQKSLVEELAQSFKALGDAMSRGTLSDGGQQAKDFADQVENIRKKGKESREGKVFDLDRDVQRERAQQNAYKKQLESETDIGRRVVIARQIEQSRAAERQAMDRVRDRPEPTGADVAGLLERAAVRMEEAGRSQRPSDTEFPVANSIREAAAGLDVGDTPEAIRAQIRALSNATSSVSRTSAQTFFGLPTEESATSNVAATAFADMTERLTAKLEAAIEDLAINVVEASRGPAEQIRQAQEEVAKAIELGLPGARAFQAELDKNATALQKSIKKLETTFSGKDENGKDLTVDEKEARTKQAQDEINALQAERARIAAQSDAFRYERTVDPQRQIDARMGRATSNLGAAGLEDGRIARRMREIENERETIRQRSALPEFQTPEMVRGLQDAEQALNEEAAAIEAATIAIKIFADALNRASEEAKGNLNSAQQRADEARRADLGNSTPQTQEARRQAEADLERQREIERQAQTEIAVERDRLEQMQQPDADRMQQIDEELKSGREFDPGLSRQRGQAEAEAASAEESRQKFANVVAAQKAFSDAADAQLQAEEELGITGTFDERDKQLKDSGRGDLVKGVDVAWAQMRKAQKAVGLEEADYSDAIVIARKELAAAIERQTQAASALAEIDEKIAASGMSGDRETLIREREALQAKMEDDARASQAKVDAARDASTREAEQAKAGERGRELSRTTEERFKAETDQGLADIQAYFERRAEANNGIRPAGDIEAQAAAEERFRKDREKEARTATSEGRGAELGMTERDRFRRDFKEGAGKDINARAKELRDQGENPAAFLRQALANQMESVAPMLQQFQEERQNAILQGPSRAALNVSDVSTTQGASELTRLLRGDDAAKDVNLAELSKQTGKLQEIVDQLKANNPGVLL